MRFFDQPLPVQQTPSPAEKMDQRESRSFLPERTFAARRTQNAQPGGLKAETAEMRGNTTKTHPATCSGLPAINRLFHYSRSCRSEILLGKQDLPKSVTAPKRSVYRSLWTAITLLTTCVIMGCGSPPDLETSRKFQQAEEAFEKAVQPDEFVRVAAMYQEILDDGFVSGSVLYNQGNAWMQAKQKGQAIACYRQAQQHLPRDPYLAANLNQALKNQAQAKPPLLNYVFFWQQSLSYREKGVLATVLLAIVLLLFLIAGATRQSKLASRLGWAAVVAFVLVAGSVVRDWYNIEWTSHGVVTVAQCTARKGGSPTYEPAFTQPLAEGTEFTVIQEQNDWLNIQIADSGEGWISKTECVTYPK